MKILTCQLADGRRIPVLFRQLPSQPVLVPFLFVILRRQFKAFNTIRNDLVAIKAFYEFLTLLNIDADEALISGELALLLGKLEQFLAWLSVSRNAQNITGRVGNRKLGYVLGISPVTRDGYLKSLKLFFIWCAQRYPSSIKQVANVESSLTASASTIASRFDSYLLAPTSPHINFRSLNDAEISAIRECSHPSSVLNPFRKQNRVRNWLILETFIETGIRIGEMLILTTKSASKGASNYYLSVVSKPEAGKDTRVNTPSLKTFKSQRTIGISQMLYERLQWYVIHERRPNRNKRPMTLTHGYLWVSERGHPLAINSVSSIFSKIKKVVQKERPGLLKSASPHSLRHTFAEQFLQYLLEIKGFDMERAKDELRAICGWSDSSSMPQYYARRYIHNMANIHNKDRVEAAWSRLDDQSAYWRKKI